jgi:hypothetical protein
MFELTAAEIGGIVAVVVGFTELIKLSKFVPDKYGLGIAAILSALGILAYAASKPELVFARTMLWPFVSAYLIVITSAAGVYGVVRESRGGDVTNASRTGFDGQRAGMDDTTGSNSAQREQSRSPKLPMWLVAVLSGSLLLGSVGCAKKPPAVVVGQAGVIAVESIYEIHKAVIALNLPKEKEIPIQEALLKANGALAPLPDLVRAIDAATKAGENASTDVDRALAYLSEGAKYIDSVRGNLNAVPTAAAVINLVVKIQQAISSAQAAIERVKAPVLAPTTHNAPSFGELATSFE